MPYFFLLYLVPRHPSRDNDKKPTWPERSTPPTNREGSPRQCAKQQRHDDALSSDRGTCIRL